MSSTPFITDAGAVSPGRQIGLNVQDAAPPTAAYMGVDDQLIVIVSTSRALGISVQINARLLMPDGTIVPNTWKSIFPVGRSAQNAVVSLPECFILSFAAYTGSGQGVLDTFVEVMILRGGAQGSFVNQVLCSGYPQINNPLSWPSGVSTDNVNCVGNIRSITGTTPGAGGEISETVPLNAKWRIISIVLSLTSSATVGTRQPTLNFTDGTNIVAGAQNSLTQPASTTVGWTFADGLSLISSNSARATVPLMRQFFMMPGWKFQSATGGLQVGDQYAAPQYVVEEWLLP